MKVFDINNEDNKKIVKDLMGRLFNSSNINWLIGSGFSIDVLNTLKDVENKLTEAVDSGDIKKQYEIYKEFFTKSIYPQIDKQELNKGKSERLRFFQIIDKLNNNRDSATLHKVVNIFTTNYDILIEKSLEELNLNFQDGFNGRINPIYSNSNYGRILSKQSNITGKTFELPIFNVYKVHGSVAWKENKEEQIITYSNYEEKLKLIYENKDDQTKFLEAYNNNLAIINPTKDKLQSTFLNTNYYDLLRMFSNELEKFNTVLLVFGFSFADEHIKQMVKRVLSFNPTMELIIFVYDKANIDDYKKVFGDFSNVALIVTEEKLNLNNLNLLLEEIGYDNE